MNRATGVQRDEFDRRTGFANESDGRIDSLLDRQYRDTSGLQERTFAEMLDQRRAGFDEQQGFDREGFDGATLADQGLVTENRRIRLEQRAIADAEQARQRGFQGQADDLAAALPGLVGFNAQRRGATDATAVRSAAAQAAVSPALAPRKGMDAMTAALTASEGNRGQAEGMTDALSAASFAGNSDAFQGAERQLGSFVDGLAALTSRARLSRASLDDELAVGGTEREQAGARRDFSADLSGRTADARSGVASNYRGQIGNAISGNADQLGDALSRFFGGSLSSEGGRADGLMGSSNRFENARTGLSNYKIGKTTAYSPLGNTLKTINDAAKEAARAANGGG